MKIKHAITAAAFLFMAGCETTGNTTGSTYSTTDGRSTMATAGTSTSGSTNPASNATNARGTLTEGATATSNSATGTNTSATNSAGTPMNSTNAAANNANAAHANSTTSAMNSTTSPAYNGNTNTIHGTTPSGTAQTGTTNNATNQIPGATSGSFTVPSTYQSSFTTRYPTATNVQWSRYNSADVPIDWELTGWAPMDQDDYTVRYNIGNDSYYAWYDSQGNWIGSAGAMKNTAGLPGPVNTLLATKYKGYTISSVNTEYWNDRTAYEVEMRNAISKAKLLVDANGTILKEKMKLD